MIHMSWLATKKTNNDLLSLNAIEWCSFFPIQGKIACANVLSDLYAMGCTEIDNMLMLLSTSNRMNEKERDIIMPLMLQGFKVNVHEYILFDDVFNSIHIN